MKYISLSLYSEKANKWKAYATTFLSRLDKSDIPEGWTFKLYYSNEVSKNFIDYLQTRIPVECCNMSNTEFQNIPMCWRFLVHDQPNVEAYYSMDMDSALYKCDIESICFLNDISIDGVIGRPTWGRMTGSKIDAGGFGLRPDRFAFSMSEKLIAYTASKNLIVDKKQADYGFDELFLSDIINPLVENKNIVNTVRTSHGANGWNTKIIAKYLPYL